MAETEDRKRAPLEESIAEARKVLKGHDEYLRGNETRTRVLVIDGVLTALGWDIKDPSRVRLEHRANGNRWTTFSCRRRVHSLPWWRPRLQIQGRRKRIGGRRLDMQRKSAPATRC